VRSSDLRHELLRSVEIVPSLSGHRRTMSIPGRGVAVCPHAVREVAIELPSVLRRAGSACQPELHGTRASRLRKAEIYGLVHPRDIEDIATGPAVMGVRRGVQRCGKNCPVVHGVAFGRPKSVPALLLPDDADDRLSVQRWGVKASLRLCACGGGGVWWRGVARRSWMTGGSCLDGWVGCLAPWTPLLIWARGRVRWRPVT
jgi:hypothetical protein